MTDPATSDATLYTGDADIKMILGWIDDQARYLTGPNIGRLVRLAASYRDTRDDLAQCERTRTSMRRILDAVAVAVKGDAPPLTSHDWSDLPERVAALRADKERLDWLAEHGIAMGSAIEMDHGIHLDGATMRAAIDSARGTT